VFAIPGSIHSTQARGCHALIKQGAKLVECAQDVLEELKLTPTGDPATGEQDAHCAIEGDPSDSETSLLNALGFDPSSLDALISRTGLDTPTLQAQLMALELQNRVARLPGGLFQRVSLA
jgi:DNA processing protein